MGRRVSGAPDRVVLDTVALIFWTLRPESLSATARTTIARALSRDACYASAISLWEIALKTSRGTLQIGLPIAEYSRRVGLIAGFKVLDVDVATWLRNVDLDWSHRDPADRTIVATAEMHEAALVTSDSTIGAFYSRVVW